jgi:hypothetical protein
VSRKLLPSRVFGNLLISLVALSFMLVGLEWAARRLGYSPDYTPSREVAERVPVPVSWWKCDERLGCRLDNVGGTLDAATLREQGVAEKDIDRLLLVNEQGFHDQDEFVDSPALDGAYKILALGDSFTYGASADLGHSFVELVEAGIQEQGPGIVWNAGIPGTGTRQALATLETLFPIMEPDVVVLGFFVGNDFSDNLYPLDIFQVVTDGQEATFVAQYRLLENGEAEKLSLQDAYLRANGQPIGSVGRVEVLVRSTSLGSGVIHAVQKIRERLPGPAAELTPWERSVAETERLIGEIDSYVASHDAHLIVLIIPEGEDFAHQGEQYTEIVRILQERSIDYVDPLSVLEEDDYTPPPDLHWNNAGHAKAAQLLLERILALREE